MTTYSTLWCISVGFWCRIVKIEDIQDIMFNVINELHLSRMHHALILINLLGFLYFFLYSVVTCRLARIVGWPLNCFVKYFEILWNIFL